MGRVLLLAMAVVAVLSTSGCAEIMKELPNAIRESQKPPLVTPEEFGKVREGISPAQIEEIVGAPPTEVHDIPRSDDKSEKLLQWTNYDGSILFVTVVDGEATQVKGYDLGGE